MFAWRFAHRLQLPVFNFKDNLRLYAITNSGSFVSISHFVHSTDDYFLRNPLDERMRDPSVKTLATLDKNLR